MVRSKSENLSLFAAFEKQIYTVSGFLDHLNEVLALEGEECEIMGEISSIQPHPTGIYLSLKDKDDGSVMSCYIYPRVYHSFGVQLEDGMEVKVSGQANIYKAKGRLSFVIKTLSLSGEGTLKKAYEALKKKLGDEGLYDRKRPLPEFIRRIGVITSRTGAVIDDFRKNVAKLGFEILLYDARVEGAKAVDDIMRGIKYFNANHPNLDVLVIMRGGGSLEDLQAFNNELIARDIFASRIPTICAIGHDRDIPIATLVSDAATSTPTAAAMLINNTWQRLQQVPMLQQRIFNHFEHLLRDQRGLLDQGAEIINLFNQRLKNLKEKIGHYEKYLTHVNPERQLKLGYSIVFDKNGNVIKEAAQLKTGESITTKLHKGSVISKVEEIK